MFSSSKKTRKALYFTKDVIEELSIKTGKSVAILEDILSQNNKYIKESILRDNEIVAVCFPNFGKMMFNYYLGKCAIARTGSVEKSNFLKSKLKYLISVANKNGINNLKNFNKPILHIGTFLLFKKVPRNMLTAFYKNWKVLEEKHNKDHEKYN